MCELNISLQQEAAIRNYALIECRKEVLEKILKCAIEHECERDLLAKYPALLHYLTEQLQPKFLSKGWCDENSLIYQLYCWYKSILWQDAKKVPSPTTVILYLFGLAQTVENEFSVLARCKLVAQIKDLCLCNLQESVFHFLASTLSHDAQVDPQKISTALDLVFVLFFRHNPLARLDNTSMCAFETMLESSTHKTEGQTYEDIRLALNTVWQFGEEMGDSKHPPKCSSCIRCDCRVLFILHAILTAPFWTTSSYVVRSNLAAAVLSYALFPPDSPLVQSQDEIVRVLLHFSEFMIKNAIAPLEECLSVHCPEVFQLLVLEEAADRADAEADAELERRKDLRLKNSIYEPVITDEEVLRIKEIQKTLIAARKDPTTGKADSVPKKGYLLAAYRYALAETQDWKVAIELVEQNPERFQKLFTGVFKMLPYYTTPEKLLQIMVKRKMQSVKDHTDVGGLTTLDSAADVRRRENVKVKTLQLAREADGEGWVDSGIVHWGTQEEVEALSEKLTQEAELREGIERSRTENKARQEFKALSAKQKKKVSAAARASAVDAPANATEVPLGQGSIRQITEIRTAQPEPEEAEAPTVGSQWGPDKMRGGRLPRPKAAVNKRTKTFDKHHARDRRMAKDER